MMIDRSRTLRRAIRLLALAAIAALAIRYLAPGAQGVVETRNGLSFAAGPLEQALDSKSSQAGTRILGDFAGPGKAPCRIFARADVSGIACKEFGGWHLRMQRDGIDIAGNDGAGANAIDTALREDAKELAATK